jgi:hypothetical protein
MIASNYGHEYRYRWDPNAVPPKATPLAPSDIFPHDGDERLATVSQLAMEEASANRPTYDNRDAKDRVAYARRAHFFFGDDLPKYETNYTRNFGPKPLNPPAPFNPKLQSSSIEFDRDAGAGPNTLRLRERGTFPVVGDAPPPNVRGSNFDVGYDPCAYRTTTADGLINGIAGAKGRVQPARAPECAEFATHGPAAGKWETRYNSDFQDRPPEANPIDAADLRRTHFELGNAETDYSRPAVAVAQGAPHHEFIDLQASNPVFRGDQHMRFETTMGDLVGVYDKSQDGRGEQIDNSGDHVFLGGDKPGFSTTAAEANRLAGTGKPAQMAQDLHLLKGVAFARGGTWDRFAGAAVDVDEKAPVEHPKIDKIDPKYYRQSHFDLEATGPSRGLYETTYFEEICRPKIFDEGDPTAPKAVAVHA